MFLTCNLITFDPPSDANNNTARQQSFQVVILKFYIKLFVCFTVENAVAGIFCCVAQSEMKFFSYRKYS